MLFSQLGSPRIYIWWKAKQRRRRPIDCCSLASKWISPPAKLSPYAPRAKWGSYRYRCGCGIVDIRLAAFMYTSRCPYFEISLKTKLNYPRTTAIARGVKSRQSILHLFKQAIWGHIWKCKVEKSQTDATSVIMQPLMQAIWGPIWKHTVAKQLHQLKVQVH